ncbi:MAG: hypothetical protein FIB02_07895 [Desulfuromonas sp.]|nr:hypothetical protein [Desulfuromonas sp.]
MLKSLVFISLGLLFVVIQGCACFPGNKLPQVDSFPPLGEEEKKKTVSYSLSAETEMFGRSSNPLARAVVENELADAIRESGYFTTWGSGINGEVTIDAQFVNAGDPAALIPAIITGLSLYIIPSWVTDEFILTATVKTQDGKEYSYKLEDESKLVQWLPMAVVPGGMLEVPLSVRKNIWKNLIIRMRQDGVLRSSRLMNGKSNISVFIFTNPKYRG